MADQALKEKIRDALRREAFNAPDDIVDVSDSDATEDFVHVVVISRQFAGRRTREKTEVIWSALERTLSPDEWGYVSLTVGAAPAEMNGAAVTDLKYI